MRLIHRGVVLVEERLKDDNFVAGLDKGHEGTKHACSLPVRNDSPST